MRTLNIITPVCRPENLPIIRADLMQYTEAGKIKIHWWLCLDAMVDEDAFDNLPFDTFDDAKYFYIHRTNSPFKNAVGGHKHRNLVIKKIGRTHINRWVYQLDDDNLLHRSFVDFFHDDALDKSVYLFSQKNCKDEVIRTPKVKVGHVDTAQVLCRLYCLEAYEFKDQYDADGHFITHLSNKYNGDFQLEEHIFTYYNKLS